MNASRLRSLSSRIRIGLTLGALVVGTLLIGSDAQAEPATLSQAASSAATTSFTSGIQVQNLSSTTANVSVAYNNSDGSSAGSQSFTIPGNQSYTLFGSTMSVLPGFQGSVVVSADQPVSAITNLLSSGPTMGEAYDGVSTPATTVNVPLFQQNNRGTNSTIYVQNTSASANNVTVTFNGGGSPVVVSQTIAGNGSWTVNGTNDTITTTFVGSAVVSGSQPVAVEVNQSNGAILFSYTGSGAGSPTVYAPLLMNNNRGYSTGLQIQNTSSSATTVSLYLNGSSTPVAGATNVPLAAGQSVTWYPIPGTAAGFVGSGTVQSSNGATLLGAINELDTISGQGMTYNGFSNGTQTVSMPLVMFNNRGYFTGEQVQNVGTCSTTVDFSINGTVVDSRVIGVGQSYTWFSNTSNPIPGGGAVAAATAHARDSCGSIVGIVNEITSPQAGGDTSFAYEGFNE